VNYRVNHLHRGGLNSNKNLIFQIPSYSGIMGHMPERFSKLLRSFGYPKETVLVYPAESTDQDRFLDISAVKYEFINRTEVRERPKTLSRLMLLYDYEVIENEKKLLERLKSATFKPQNVVLIEDKPPADIKIKKKKSAKFIPIIQNSQSKTDRIAAEFETDFPGILLFSESYSSDWRAYIDDEEVPIYRANFNFMACFVTSGQHLVEFRFQPQLFYLSRKITFLGLIIFVLGVFLMPFYKSKRS